MSKPASLLCACGALKSSPEYQMCRACWRAHVTAGTPLHPLKAWADAKGWSVQRLAREAGLHNNTLRHIIRGRRRCSGDSARALAKVTDISIEELLAFDPRAALTAEAT